MLLAPADEYLRHRLQHRCHEEIQRLVCRTIYGSFYCVDQSSKNQPLFVAVTVRVLMAAAYFLSYTFNVNLPLGIAIHGNNTIALRAMKLPVSLPEKTDLIIFEYQVPA